MTEDATLRVFTDKGIDVFQQYLAQLRKDPAIAPPDHLLTDPETSADIETDIRIAQKSFYNRLELARYLDDIISPLVIDGLETDRNLWSWLSLYYFDQVCPVEKTGIRKPGRDYRHILEPGYPNGHRHLLAGAYLVYTVYGLGDKLSRLLLWTPLPIESRFHHQLAVRQTLITNRGVLEAARLMYFNESGNRPKRGALGREKTPGTLLRFIDVVQQLDLTYDLYSMSGREILKLLPPEFNRWTDKIVLDRKPSHLHFSCHCEGSMTEAISRK